MTHHDAQELIHQIVIIKDVLFFLTGLIISLSVFR